MTMRACASLLLSAALCGCAAVGAETVLDREGSRLGDADPWRVHAGGGGVRRPLAEQLVASGALMGKTCEELWDMLGPEDPVVAQCPGFGDRWFDSAWGLGPGETELLQVKYGEDHRAAAARIR